MPIVATMTDSIRRFNVEATGDLWDLWTNDEDDAPCSVILDRVTMPTVQDTVSGHGNTVFMVWGDPRSDAEIIADLCQQAETALREYYAERDQERAEAAEIDRKWMAADSVEGQP